jgi:uncharacterized membrane protein YdfJ with MMPL/SSD domain
MRDRQLPLAVRHPRGVLLGALVLVLAAAFLGLPGLASMRGGETDFNDPGTESQAARAALVRVTGADSEQGFVALVDLRGIGDLRRRPAVVAAVRARLAHAEGVHEVADFWSSHDAAMLARDRSSTYVVAAMGDVSQREGPITRRLRRELRANPELARRVRLGGETAADAEVNDRVSRDLALAERLAFPFLLLALVIVFRGLRAALTPLACAVATLLLSLAALRIVMLVTPISVYSLNLLSAMAVGLSIDYGLLLLSRHREESAGGRAVAESLTLTMRTAGRTIAVSAITVSVALCALLVFPQRFLYSMALGGIVASAVAALSARTILPALLMLLGSRVLPSKRQHGWARRGGASRAWTRWAQLVTSRPLSITAVAIALLLLAGIPFLGARFVGIDASVLPNDASAHQVASALARSFAAGSAGPVRIVVTAQRPRAVASYLARVRATRGVESAFTARHLGGDLWEVDAITRASPLSAPARRVVRTLRRIRLPGVAASITGTTASFVDLQASIARHIPLALLLLSLAMVAVLFAATASVIVPIKTVVLNLMTISAVFGLLVLIFQDGRLTGLLSYAPQGGIETTQPILLFATTFGLATDYAVFLISRIKEAHDAGVSTRESVVLGVARTGRVVTAAALLFSIAVGAFATSSIVFLKELGVGIVLGVLIDAFVIRTLVAPNLMVLLGRWNWWCPRRLRAAHRRLRLSAALEFAAAPRSGRR